MRIVVDLQGAQTNKKRGIGRYCVSLARALAQAGDEHETLIALNGLFPDTIETLRDVFEGIVPQGNIRVWEAPGPVHVLNKKNAWRRHTAELIREAFLARLQPDAVLVGSIFEGFAANGVSSIGRLCQNIPTAVIHYDLIPYVQRDEYLADPVMRQWYLEKMENLHRADRLLAISNSSREEVIDLLGKHAADVVNISGAADDIFRAMDIDAAEQKRIRAQYNLRRPFIMYVGGFDPRKNLEGLIQAYAQLPARLRKTYQLAIAGDVPAGNRAQLEQMARSAGLRPDEFVMTGYVPDNDLAMLYNLCAVFVIPSLHEGFGLPALEAMQSGAPVIGANTSSLPEVIGRPEALFDPFAVPSIAGKLIEALEDEPFRQRLREEGLRQAAGFSWSRCAEEALQALSSMAKASGANRGPSVAVVRPAGLREDLIERVAGLPDGPQEKEPWIRAAAAIAEALPEPRGEWQLFVDVSELAQRDAKSGIQRVVRGLLNQLLRHPPEGCRVEPVYATTDGNGYRYARRFTQRFLGLDSPVRDEVIDAQPGDVFLALDLQAHVVLAQAGHLARLRQRGIPVYFVVYDLIPVLHPDVFPTGTAEVYTKWLEAVAKMDGALCISHAVASELGHWIEKNVPDRARPFQIDWFHMGGDIESSVPTSGLPKAADEVLKALDGRPTFLCVGTIEPRKRYEQVLDAFDRLWKDGADANLVIVGRQGWMVDDLTSRLRAHPEYDRRLFWLDGISDEYLEALYTASDCLLAASSAEGFGLPIVEAARRGVPLLVRDIPVFREVAGDCAVYFRGGRPQDLADAVLEWLALKDGNRLPDSTKIAWLTWEDSAHHLKQALLERRRWHLGQADRHALETYH